jgi:hypothetical protein
LFVCRIVTSFVIVHTGYISNKIKKKLISTAESVYKNKRFVYFSQKLCEGEIIVGNILRWKYKCFLHTVELSFSPKHLLDVKYILKKWNDAHLSSYYILNIIPQCFTLCMLWLISARSPLHDG